MRYFYLALSLLLFCVACSEPQSTVTLNETENANPDYMQAELREQVEGLKQAVAAAATTEATAVERSRIVFDWINAYSLEGGYIPVNATQTVARIGGYGIPTPAEVDELIAELTLMDETPEAIGSLVANIQGDIIAGSRATFTQTYTVGAAAVEVGGGFLIAKHFNANHADYQTADAAGDNYVSIASSNPAVRFEVDEFSYSGMHGGFRGAAGQLVFRVADANLNPGDTATITYGDRAGGGGGLLMPDFNSDQMPFPIYLDLDASNLWLSLPIQPVPISGGVATQVAGFAPSIVTPGEAFELSIRAADAFGNRALGELPDWELRDQNDNLIAAVPANGSAVVLTELSLPEEGIYRFRIQEVAGDIVGEVNPILVTANPSNRIYWGDTHGHSGFAEGIGSAAAFMQFARDEARLDFVTHSEHDAWMDDSEWAVLQRMVQQYNEDGRFVSFIGYEWTMSTTQGGHHNVLFRTPENRQRVPSQFYPSLSQLYQGLREQNDTNDVLVIPPAHQKGDYRLSDPEMETLVEIMSMHGTFDWFARMYLNHGHMVGFVAASDDHIGKPGLSQPKTSSLAQRGGLAAVLAPDRSKDSLFDAMKSLNTYATSGQRIIMDVNVNGTTMGQRARYATERAIAGRVIGTAPIRSVTLFKNDHVLQEWSYNEVNANELALWFYSESYPYHPDDNPRGWRHWRGTIEITGAPLGSAELVDLQNLSVQQLTQDPANPNRLTFSTLTRGDHSTILLRFNESVENVQVNVALEDSNETGGGPPLLRRHQRIPAADVQLSTASMTDGQVTVDMSFDDFKDQITLSRGGTLPLEVDFALNDSANPRHGDYYFVRVRQQDEGLAWSSPIWVGGSSTQ